MVKSTQFGRLALLFAVALLVHQLAAEGYGQRGRGGPFGGGPGGSSGRGGPPGGGRPSFGGGPPGGGMPMFNPADILRRMDANGNGQLDPEESQGRARYFIERFAGDMKLDLNRPIPIDKLASAMASRMRDRSSGGGSSSWSGRSSQPSSSGGPADVEPLVPGFGVEMPFDPIPGFGGMAEFFAVEVTDKDTRYAEDRFRRYDRNGDGYLSKDELRSGRWSDDPMQYDRNLDGKLSVQEMSVRYARRRINEEGGGDSKEAKTQVFFNPAAASSGGSSNSSSSSKSNPEARAQAERYLGFMMQRYDRNKNGTIDKDEWGSMRSDPTPYDKNRDGKLDKNEVLGYLESRFGQARGGSDRGGDRGRGSWGGSSRGGWGGGDRGGDRGGDSRRFYTGSDNSGRSNGGSSEEDDRRSYRTMTNLERLERDGVQKQLPSWFSRDDGNADGQVLMAEFSRSWSSSVARDFAKFDLNGDGVITAVECVRAVEEGAARGATSSSSGYSRSSSSYSRSSGSSSPSKSSGDSSDSPATAAPAASGDIPTKYMRYASGIVSKYDSNKDGVLVASEWAAMSKDPSGADADGDGKVTAEEYARSMMK